MYTHNPVLNISSKYKISTVQHKVSEATSHMFNCSLYIWYFYTICSTKEKKICKVKGINHFTFYIIATWHVEVVLEFLYGNTTFVIKTYGRANKSNFEPEQYKM